MNDQLRIAIEKMTTHTPFVSSDYIVGVNKEGTASLYQVSSGKLIALVNENEKDIFILRETASAEKIVTEKYNESWGKIIKTMKGHVRLYSTNDDENPNNQRTTTMKILSVDAWAEPEGGWTWNNWFHVGDISKTEFEALEGEKAFRHWFKRNGYTRTASKRIVSIEDDQYNICLCDAKDGRPIYAIEYGREY